ncbi:NPC intracellular cholesterol transporter 2 homolog a-like [Oratosquilla oratoria]|uniref:NPC intracellular cholesterol transporter 2 homolog a-like n=1 Tax=Oratosquilla oratoria TaxID=337810 RepID=UPI003F767A0C
MQMSAVTLGLLVLVCSVVSAVKIRTCDSATADVDFQHINITGCGRSVCIFKKGESAQMQLPFTPKYEVSSLTAKVHGIIAGIPIPFNGLPNDGNACISAGLKCPLKANQPVIYSASLPVQSIYPSITLKVKWELIDSKGQDVVCILFPVRLQ